MNGRQTSWRRFAGRARNIATTTRHVLGRGAGISLGRLRLRGCDVVGRWSRTVSGRAIIENRGRIEIGSRTRLMCRYGPIELRTAPSGTLTIGSRTAVNFGTLIDVSESVRIGDNVSIGPYCVIADAEAGSAGAPSAAPPTPIVIEDGAWLASRVTLLPGAHIGAGTVVTAGSIVSGATPPRVVVGGIPARVLRHLDQDEQADDPRPHAVTATHTAAGVETWTRGSQDPPSARGLLISDFTIDPLVAALEATQPAMTAELAPFGAVAASLLAPASDHDVGVVWDFAVVWTQPDRVLPAFRSAVDFTAVDEDALLAEVDDFVRLISAGADKFPCVVVPTWTIPPWQRGRGLVDSRRGGIAWTLALANQRLASALGDVPNVFVVDAQRWIALTGADAYSDRLYYLGKIPFVDEVFRLAAAEIVAAVTAVQGSARKLVVVDLDNTLWGGVVGDVGWQDIRLGGHDSVGEAYVDFQRALKGLRHRGVLLAIASKNEESVALEAFDQHGEMILTRDDFVAWRINWNDKGANVAELAAELNLGLQSVVFIDDNAHERARVRATLPEVLVPEWPDDPTQFVRSLASLTCFDSPAVTAEDLQRTALYAAEQRREAIRVEVDSLDEWIRQLDIVVTAELLNTGNLPRAAQLLNKTNQMNLRTRRMTSTEFRDWPREGERATWCISVVDRLGDAGLTGLLSIEVDGATARIVDFVLSCRVMGRKVEDTMAYLACRMADDLGATSLLAEYLPTPKNIPCKRFFDGGLFGLDGEGRYHVDLTDPVPKPDGITVHSPETSALGPR